MDKILVLMLAGGDSERLWPMSDKNFINFFNKPLIYFTLKQLQKFGFKNILIVVNSQNESKFNVLKSQFKELNIRLIRQQNKKGMAGAVLSCREFIKDRKILIINPTDIHDDFLIADFQRYLEGNPDGIMVGTKVNNYFPGGYLTVKDGYITSITEKPGPDNIPSNIVNFVFDYFSDSSVLIDNLNNTKSKKDDIYERAIADMIKKRFRIRYLDYKGYWGYIKYPWHILSLMDHYLSSITASRIFTESISKSSHIYGNVIIEENVRILDNATIIGPSYLGGGTLIGQNTLIRESMIGNNCVIGFSTEVARSYIGSGSFFHHNYIGDSIIGNNINMGSGALTANYKFDESPVTATINKERINTDRVKLGALIGDNSRIGVNAALMPGVKVGRNTFVGSSVTLYKDLPDSQYCYLKQESFAIKNNRIKK